MKILHIISHFPPAYSYGGPCQQAYLICRELVKRGHNVSVYTTDVLDAKTRYCIESNPIFLDGIEVYHFKNISNNLAHMNFSCAPEMVIALRKNIKKYDIVHIHEYRTFQIIVTHHYAKKFDVPYIFQARGDIIKIDRLQNLKFIFDLIWGIPICRDAAFCIPTTKIEAIDYKKMGVPEERIRIISNAIDSNIHDYFSLHGNFRKRYDIEQDTKIILFLGRLQRIKGLDLLVNSFARLRKTLDNVCLVIAGPDEGMGSSLKSLAKKQGIEKDVIFTGPLYGNQKIEAYLDADVFVLPSKFESFGTVVIEALVCGTPVIVTKLCGVAEWITDEIGYIINFDEQELSLALKNILSDNKKRIMMRENANKHGENFSIKQTIMKFEKVYANAIFEDTSKK